MRKKVIPAVTTLLLLTPAVVVAKSFSEVVTDVVGLINITVPVIFGLALLVFLWGLASFVLKSGDTRAVEEGKNRMLYGVIGLFVMFAVWGLVNLVGRTLGIL